MVPLRINSQDGVNDVEQAGGEHCGTYRPVGRHAERLLDLSGVFLIKCGQPYRSSFWRNDCASTTSGLTAPSGIRPFASSSTCRHVCLPMSRNSSLVHAIA